MNDPGIDEAARAFLKKLVETNIITFGDELSAHGWSGGFYVNNAIYRVTELEGQARSFAGGQTLRQSWLDAFNKLDALVEGTITGTVDVEYPHLSE